MKSIQLSSLYTFSLFWNILNTERTKLDFFLKTSVLNVQCEIQYFSNRVIFFRLKNEKYKASCLIPLSNFTPFLFNFSPQLLLIFFLFSHLFSLFYVVIDFFSFPPSHSRISEFSILPGLEKSEGENFPSLFFN